MTQPLAGCTVAVTAERRADELATLLERRGASVRKVPAIHIVALADDAELRSATAQVIEAPPELVVATTGVGLRGWLAAAAEWGLGDALEEALRGSRLVARGPKAKGAIRGAGLREEWSPASESSAEVHDHLVAEGIDGSRIAVQLHGQATRWEPLPDLAATLRAAGADVLGVPVYRWVPPPQPAALDALIDDVAAARVQCVSFTSAPAVASILDRADATGRLDPFLAAMNDGVLAACVGPVTAGPLDALGVRTAQPARYRLSDLARLIVDELPRS